MRIQTGNGLARRIHLALIALLSLGLVGSFWLSLRARSEAESAAVRQARDIVEDSLTVVFQPDDLAAPVSGDRLRELAREVDDVVVDPSDFDHVTLFSGSGEILFSTEDGEIGQRLAGERTPVRDAFQGEPQVRIAGDAFSVLVGLRFPSGVGETAAIELTRPLTQITAAAGPWRTNMLFLGGALALVIVAVAGGGRRIEDEGPRDLRIRVPVIAARQPAQQTVRSIEAPQPGLKEEAEARRRAEGRAKSAEERLAVLQEQYRTTLDELQTTQRTLDERPLGQDRVLEERAVKAEAAARSLEQRLHTVTVERDRIASELLAVRDDAAVGGVDQLHQAEAEAMGLRAELEGAQTQLSLTLQELTSIQRQAERARELQEELDAAQLEALHARDAMDAMQEELRSGRTELEDARGELRALRNEEQRATELSDEVRAARAELDSLRASHRAELVEREADLEDKVRTLREEFQAQLAEAEARHTEQVARMRQEHALEVSSATRGAAEASARVAETGADLEAARAESQARAVDLESAKAELQAAHDRIEELQRATDERTADAHQATDEAERARSERDAAATELSELRTALAEAQGLLAEERSRREQLEVSGSRVTDEAHAADERATQLAEELEAAAVANADLNRRLQEIEARRALEIADDEGRAHIDELLTATQERLAGQTEKLMAAEERVRELERRSEVDVARVEELEAQLRQHQMSDQIREIQGKHEARDEVRPDGEPDAMDRQGATAFVREMSIDAQKTVARMLGIVQLLKHKRDAAKEHAQLVQQLTAYARRLDNTIHDLSDVDSLVTGTIELELRRTDLEPLIRRVVDESGIGEEHDIRVEAESLRIPVDRVRTEQIVAGLLSSAADRTSAGKTITVRLIREKTGATIVIEVDAAEVSLSPMMRRLAEVQGGWAKAGARDGGGSEVRVFLPAGGAAGSAPEEPAPVEPIAETPSDLAPEEDPNHWVKAEQALVRELRELSQGKARK